MRQRYAVRDIGLAAAAACTFITLGGSSQPAQAQRQVDQGRYTTGDFHNHSTCSDGQISVQKLVNKSVDTYGLDWFVMAGHGGNGNRNCTLVDDAQTGAASGYPYVEGQGPGTTWGNSIGTARIKGDLVGTDTANSPDRRMWRWQSIQEFQYPVLERMSELKRKPLFVGLESVVAGHEHGNMSITTGQLPLGGGGNGTAVAQWEYCFDRADADLSRGEQGWDCAVPGSAMNAQLNERGRKLTNNSGTAGHLKTVEGIKWMAAFHPDTSYYIPAHVERAGIFNPNGSNGFNIEHFRNFNNAAPNIAFGMEGGPGHQANANRSYGTGAAGRGTYGGMGYYAAKVGGLWDTLLGEGRNWWIFNNSDYHNRGAFGPDAPQSTNDQYPGEFNMTYVLTRTGGAAVTPKDIVDGMRSGNAYFVNGDLIDRKVYVVCRINATANRVAAASLESRVLAAAKAGTGFFDANCAQQGEKLVVRPGEELRVIVALRDPEGTNRAPYTLPNPSLLQVGINQPLNQPVLHHVDLIGGLVTGYIQPNDPRYSGAAPGGRNGEQDSPNTLNPSTAVKATFNASNWRALPGGWKMMSYRMKDVRASQYLRLRGTNMPAGVPNETDADGNPLVDSLGHNITVVPTDPACANAELAPTVLNCVAHLPAQGAGRQLNNDVEAFTDLWFYSNPVYVEVMGGVPVAGVGNRTVTTQPTTARAPAAQAVAAQLTRTVSR